MAQLVPSTALRVAAAAGVAGAAYLTLGGSATTPTSGTALAASPASEHVIRAVKVAAEPFGKDALTCDTAQDRDTAVLLMPPKTDGRHVELIRHISSSPLTESARRIAASPVTEAVVKLAAEPFGHTSLPCDTAGVREIVVADAPPQFDGRHEHVIRRLVSSPASEAVVGLTKVVAKPFCPEQGLPSAEAEPWPEKGKA